MSVRPQLESVPEGLPSRDGLGLNLLPIAGSGDAVHAASSAYLSSQAPNKQQGGSDCTHLTDASSLFGGGSSGGGGLQRSYPSDNTLSMQLNNSLSLKHAGSDGQLTALDAKSSGQFRAASSSTMSTSQPMEDHSGWGSGGHVTVHRMAQPMSSSQQVSTWEKQPIG